MCQIPFWLPQTKGLCSAGRTVFGVWAVECQEEKELPVESSTGNAAPKRGASSREASAEPFGSRLWQLFLASQADLPAARCALKGNELCLLQRLMVQC